MGILKRLQQISLICVLLLLIVQPLIFAQNVEIQGVVLNEEHTFVSAAVVYVDGEKVATTNAKGQFSFAIDKNKKINTLNVIKRGYKMQTWATNGPGKIQVLLSNAPVFINGTVKQGGIPIGEKLIKIGGQPFPAVKTNKSGKFQLRVNKDFKVKTSTVFLVDGDPVKSNQYHYSKQLNIVTINLPGKIKEKPALAKNEKTNVQKDEPTPDPNSTVVVEDIEISPILVVVVYDEDISPADSLLVNINEQEFLTDQNGEFEVYADSLNENSLLINDYDIVKTKYDYEDNYMFVYISSDEGLESQGETNIEYSENFQTVFNTLEAEKQILQETGVSLRKEIQKIAAKLEKDHDVKSQKALESYLMRLQNSLIENELAYEDAQYKTNQMMERMRSQISQQTSTIEQIEGEKEEVETERMLYFIIAAISLILIFIFYKNLQKMKEQRDDLKEISERLAKANDEVVKSHEEMLSVKDIGQKFTSTLDFENHMIELQESVNELVPAPTFGIGVFNKLQRRLEFRNQISDNGTDPYYTESIDNAYSLAAWCFNNEIELIINDYDKENTLYIPQKKTNVVSPNKSLIYMPLMIDMSVVGVITIQAPEVNQYQELNISILKSLASYASIAVSNYTAYKELKEKNKSITDSMRYAKTIQSAILPSRKLLSESFKDYFLLYRSKEIVSGDFYWYKEKMIDGKLRKYIAVVDCTGHGVPGAFMSMIGSALLNDIVSTKTVTQTDEILNMLNEGVKESLRQEESLNDDGMDIALICIESETEDKVNIQFTGAKRPIMIFDHLEKKLNVVNGDSKSIGYSTRKEKNFSNHQISLNKNDIIYLTSDGYVDQNNLSRRKIGSIKLKEILEQNATMAMTEQKEYLLNFLKDHRKGGIEQRDDITIMGIKV
ncbi:GAF domain-containing SpoIIE family protein phosphatase [Flammeovirga agarivorans]|uniref:SpoIIE family protein phosphatase n=1 Tax=Flammeovirga agarivorans TaxID=2726742 RepID=A0A7X8XWM0_9BACT|nr:SpoIIE family protein phosphatase [Flammeovirga agarivorans]NLR92344.1 SpoIIE family protein phosphatase [Flammeovirga agarivorans]